MNAIQSNSGGLFIDYEFIFVCRLAGISGVFAVEIYSPWANSCASSVMRLPSLFGLLHSGREPGCCHSTRC